MGATRPDGSSATPQRVTFTRAAADRIADAVLKVERGNRDSQGLAWHPRMDAVPSKQESILLAKFTGSASWVKMTARQCFVLSPITQTGVEAPLHMGAYSGQTVTAVSVLFSIPGFTGNTSVTTNGVMVYLQNVNGVYQVVNAEGA